MALSKIRNDSLADTAVHGRRNLIINGAMQVAQRGTSETGVTSGGYKQAPDRFSLFLTTAGTWTVSQSTDAPDGFSNSYKFDCTTADASLAAGDIFVCQQAIEGQDLQRLKKGTSNAESVTLSFYVKASKTGTYIAELNDGDNSRQISQAYTISSANTWEKKTLTYSGDTTGALNNDNGASLYVVFWLAAGSNFTSGTLSTSWSTVTAANRAVGQVNLADSTSNEFYITGVQLEVGDKATPFEHRSYGEELALCQRYFYVYGGENGAPNLQGYGKGGDNTFGFAYPTNMRAAPSGTVSGTWVKSNCADPTLVHMSSRQFSIRTSVTSEGAFEVYPSGSSGKIHLDAEL